MPKASCHPTLYAELPVQQQMSCLTHIHAYVAGQYAPELKPSWFLQLNPNGKVPVLAYREEGDLHRVGSFSLPLRMFDMMQRHAMPIEQKLLTSGIPFLVCCDIIHRGVRCNLPEPGVLRTAALSQQVYESNICNEFLEDYRAEPPLLPPHPAVRARGRMIIQQFSEKFVPNFYKLLLRSVPSFLDQTHSGTM